MTALPFARAFPAAQTSTRNASDEPIPVANPMPDTPAANGPVRDLPAGHAHRTRGPAQV